MSASSTPSSTLETLIQRENIMKEFENKVKQLDEQLTKVEKDRSLIDLNKLSNLYNELVKLNIEFELYKSQYKKYTSI
jgi:methionyl-tRNA synthetase